MPAVTMLPVLARELLVASRKKQTYQVRLALAFVATAITAITTWVVEWFDISPIRGPQLFQFLTFILYAGGVMSATGTLDAISVEKREGTLGLLFLTRLRGYDVVLGKLAPAALLSLYGFISVTPIMAVPVLMGGVGFGELLRTALALGLIILWSLSLGLMISTLVRNSARAMAGLGISLAIWAFAAYEILTKTPIQHKAPELIGFILLFNPKHLLAMAGGSAFGLSSGLFLASVATHVAMILAFLLIACWLLPRTWQEKVGSRGWVAWKERYWRWRFGASEARVAYRKRLMQWNPVLWLRSRELVSLPGFWIALVLFGSAALWIGTWNFKMTGPAGPLFAFGFGWMITSMGLGFWILGTIPAAMGQALAEDRQSGALDLLVSTPLSEREIVRGHWLAAARRLALPGLAALLVGCLAFFWALAMFRIEDKIEFHFLPSLVAGLRTAVSWDAPEPNETSVIALLLAGGVLLLPIALRALAWTGIWLGLKVQQPKNVAGLSFPTVVVPPWALWLAIRGVIIYGNTRFGWTIPENPCSWVVLWFACAGGYLLTLSFIVRRKVLTQFRQMATDRYTNIETSRWARWLGIKGKA